MASTYVNNLRLEEIGSGEQSGTWGDTTNTNLEIIGQAVAWGTRAIADASTDNITIADGALDADRCLGLKLTGGGQACTVTLLPNTSSKTWFMYNATAAALTFTCGSGANVIIPAGQTKVIATDGLGSGGVVHDLLTAVNLAGTTVVDDLTVSDDLSVGDDLAVTGLATVGGTLGVTGVVTANAGVNSTGAGDFGSLTVDTLNLNASSITGSSNLTVDIAGDINFDAAGSQIRMKKDGTVSYTFELDATPDLNMSGGNSSITAATSDASFTIIGNDGGVAVNALAFDMANAGDATFAADVNVGTDLDVAGNAVIDGTALVTGVLTTTAATVFNGGFAANDGSTITTNDNSTQLTLKSTDTDASGGPILDLTRDNDSAAANDVLGLIRFKGDDAGNNETTYAQMIGFIGTATEGSEGGIFKIEVASHDAGMEVGLAIKDGNADGELDVDIASGTSSLTSVAGNLDVAGNAVIDGNLTSAGGLVHQGDTNTSLDFGTDQQTFYVGGVRALDLSTSAAVFNEGSADVDFRVESNDNTHMLFVDAANNGVAIGHNNPQDILHISTTNAASHIRVQRHESDEALGDGDEIGAVEFWANDSTSFSGASTLRAAIRAEVQNTSLGTRLEFYTGNSSAAVSERMRIIADGKIGINQTEPSRLLHITDTIANGGGQIGLTSSDSSTTGSMGILHFGNSTDSSLASVGAIADGATDSGVLLFKTEASGAAIEERMRINSVGSVGIGVADGDVTSDGTAARTYVGIIGTANRGRLNIGSTASNGADAGMLAFTNGSNVLGSIVVDTNSGVQNAGIMYLSSTGVLDVRAAGGVIFNENSVDADFRVESNGNANMLVVDGGDDSVRVGGASGEAGDTFSVVESGANVVNSRFRNSNADANGMRITFEKASASPANNDEIVQLDFMGRDSAGNAELYAGIQCFIDDVTSGTEDGILRFGTISAGTYKNRLDILPTETVFNQDSADLDFRVESNDSMKMLFVDGGNNGVLIDSSGADLRPYTTLDVTGQNNTEMMIHNDTDGAGEHAALLFKADSQNESGGARSRTKAGIFFVRDDPGTRGTGKLHIAVDGNNDDTNVAVNDAAISITADGEVTMPKTPAFLARPASAQTNFGADGNNDTVLFGTEVFDQNADFASNTFTAPVTGKYQLSVNLYLTDLDSAASYYQMTLITSNRNYFYAYDVSSTDSDPNRFTFQINALVDMDASDTASVGILQSGGTAQTDINVESFFSGFLAC